MLPMAIGTGDASGASTYALIAIGFSVAPA